jgi:hypothetical protein
MAQQEKKGRNQIVYELAQANIKASAGSVSNILKEWKHDQPGETVNELQPNENLTMQTAVYTHKENEDSLQDNESQIDFDDLPYKDSYPYLYNNDVQSVDAEPIDATIEKEAQGEIKSECSSALSNITHTSINDLECKKASLLKQIEDSQRIMEANKKAADDLKIVKEEMVKCGIEADSADFIKVIRIFRKFGHDPSVIMNTFLEIQDVAMERERIKNLKEETDHKLSVLRRKLEEIGLGDFEKLKQIVVSLMTLETYGIGIEQIISYYHSIRAQNNRKPQYIGGRIA